MFSTSKGDDSSSTDSTGLPVFYDADKDKLNILKYIKGKSGIYMWTGSASPGLRVASPPEGLIN